MEVFLAVAMSRTFGKAADMLNVTPSSISRELKHLEEEIGMLLVDRQKGVKSVRLTPAGEAFLPLVVRWQEAKKELSSAYNRHPAYFLSVAGCETANNSLLPDIFISLMHHDPPVHLKIMTDPTDMLYEKVESREVDVAFVVHQEPSRFVRTTQIFEDEMVVVRFDEEGREAIDGDVVLHPAELDASSELYIEWSQDFRIWHNDMWDPATPVPVELLTTYLLPNMMTHPGQWALVPECTIKDIVHPGREECIRTYRLGGNPPRLCFYKLTHRNPKISAIGGLEVLDKILAEHGMIKL